jgi:hypothetical protein
MMDVVYNRHDCPYGEGTPLPPKLRWQRTPCPGCGRPLFPLQAVLRDGVEIWPPAHVPRPAQSDDHNRTVWYVVTEDDAREGVARSNAETRRRVDQADSGVVGVVGFLALPLVVGLLTLGDLLSRPVRALLRLLGR